MPELVKKRLPYSWYEAVVFGDTRKLSDYEAYVVEGWLAENKGLDATGYIGEPRYTANHDAWDHGVMSCDTVVYAFMKI